MTRRPLALLLAAAMTLALAPVAAVGLAGRPLADDRYAVLVMGSDMGPWRSGRVTGGRADALHLLVVVPSQRSASILSFPRDLYVPVPGLGSTRINAALTRGPGTAVETVEGLTGIEIDDWIVTGMKAYEIGIEDFGGVEIDVPQRLRLDTSVLEPGRQRLDGRGALIYTRDRKSRSDGDFGRNQAQAHVLARLHKELVQRDPSLPELMELVAALRRTTVSSISPARTAVLARTALTVDPANVVRKQVPGRNASRGGASVVVATGGADALYADLRDDGMLTP